MILRRHTSRETVRVVREEKTGLPYPARRYTETKSPRRRHLRTPKWFLLSMRIIVGISRWCAAAASVNRYSNGCVEISHSPLSGQRKLDKLILWRLLSWTLTLTSYWLLDITNLFIQLFSTNFNQNKLVPKYSNKLNSDHFYSWMSTWKMLLLKLKLIFTLAYENRKIVHLQHFAKKNTLHKTECIYSKWNVR